MPSSNTFGSSATKTMTNDRRTASSQPPGAKRYSKLSIIIPVYNEESTIDQVLESVLDVDVGSLAKEVIVVDDGSTDASPQIIKARAAHQQDTIKVYMSPVNFGKGAAIRVGLKYVSGEITLIQDADLELDPAEYNTLIEPILSGEAKVVYGSRFREPVPGLPWRALIANKILTGLANLLYRARITDEATAYKVFDTDVIKTINLNCIGFEFCPEVTAKLCKRGFNIVEVPIGYKPRTAAEGKKVTWRDGLIAVWTLLRYRLKD